MVSAVEGKLSGVTGPLGLVHARRSGRAIWMSVGVDCSELNWLATKKESEEVERAPKGVVRPANHMAHRRDPRSTAMASSLCRRRSTILA